MKTIITWSLKCTTLNALVYTSIPGTALAYSYETTLNIMLWWETIAKKAKHRAKNHWKFDIEKYIFFPLPNL